jgi:hypothetical protein
MSAPTLTSNVSKSQIGLGTIISIGPAASVTGSPVWVPIGAIIDAKFSGASATVIKFSPLDGGLGVQKRSGTRDYGTVDLTYERAPGTGDAGQTAAKTAFEDPTGQPYQFQAALFVGPGQTTAGDIATFTGIISKYNPISEISADKNVEGMLTIELSSPISIAAGS